MGDYFIPKGERIRGPIRFPCPTCGIPCVVRASKKGKPYFHCDGCVVQVFIRGRTGTARLTQWARDSRSAGASAPPPIPAPKTDLRALITADQKQKEVNDVREKRLYGDHECEVCSTIFELEGDSSLKCPKCGGYLVPIEYDDDEGKDDR